jgi:hypothetical protein
MRAGVLGTNLSLRALSRRLVALGTPASRRTIRRLLRKLKRGRRTARKKKTMGHHPDRNAPLENIARLRREYEVTGDAVMSSDTKKKEWLGNFHRAGTTFTTATVATFDNNFGSAGQGKLIPHGIYDMGHQHVHIHLKTSHDTSALCCDGIVKLLGIILLTGNRRYFPDVIATDPPFRRPAVSPLFQPNSQIVAASLCGTPARTVDAVWGESAG